MKRLEDYRGIVDDAILAELHRRASRLFDRHVIHMNSTAYGGGVAELLTSLVPLMNDAGVSTGWRVLLGTSDFFQVTKKFHNALQGGELNLSAEKKDLYVRTNEDFAQYTHIEMADAVIIHDPQPLPIIGRYRKRQPWIWRCHVDLSQPNNELWEYLKTFILRYDLVLVSHESYLQPDLPVEQRVVHPAIDPLTQKNKDLDAETIEHYLAAHSVPLDKPLIAQISRFDRWKDPFGVVEVYRKVRENVDCRLVLAGNVAVDDPESGEVISELRAMAADLIESGHLVMVTGAPDIVVNALQRSACVILQKSLREGFGLTISEALWKGTPVVASNVGGIPLQLRDGEDGYLVQPDDTDTFAARITHLIEDRATAETMGQSGRERIRRDYLITRLVGHDLALVADLLG